MGLGDFLNNDPTREDADAVDLDVALRLGVIHLDTPGELLEAQSPSRVVVATRFLQYAIAHDDALSLSHIRKNSIEKVFEELQEEKFDISDNPGRSTEHKYVNLVKSGDEDASSRVDITTKQGIYMVFSRLFKESSNTQEAIENWVKDVRDDYDVIETAC